MTRIAGSTPSSAGWCARASWSVTTWTASSDPRRQQAIRRFQRENDLKVTGQVDDRTWDALRAYKRKG